MCILLRLHAFLSEVPSLSGVSRQIVAPCVEVAIAHAPSRIIVDISNKQGKAGSATYAKKADKLADHL